MKKILIYILLGTFSFAFSPTIEKPFELLRSALSKLIESENIAFTYEMKSTCDSEKGLNTSKVSDGRVEIIGNKIRIKQGELLLLMDKEYKLIISAKEKFIVIDKPSKPDFKSIISIQDQIGNKAKGEVLNLQSGEKKIVFTNLGDSLSYIDKSEILIDKAGRIKQTEIYLNRDQQPDELYKCDRISAEYRYDSNLSQITIPETSSIIRKKDDAFHGLGAYSKYKIIVSPNLMNQ